MSYGTIIQSSAPYPFWVLYFRVAERYMEAYTKLQWHSIRKRILILQGGLEFAMGNPVTKSGKFCNAVHISYSWKHQFTSKLHFPVIKQLVWRLTKLWESVSCNKLFGHQPFTETSCF